MAKQLQATQHDIGGLFVKRVLPQRAQRMVGPFIFFDHMGPGTFARGQGINVRPHPHIGLSTLSYLFDGSMLHRDSLGNHIEIEPGDVNWMTAGKGIVHSERESIEVRAQEHSIDGLQCWIALPEQDAEVDPNFIHIKKSELPHHIVEGVTKRVVAGSAYGLTAPFHTYSPLFYVDVVATPNADIEIPHPTYETAIYVLFGEVSIGNAKYQQHDFIVLDDETVITTHSDSRFIMLGGEAFDNKPLIEWNFVAYSKERMEQAKRDWREGKFPVIEGDNNEHIPY